MADLDYLSRHEQLHQVDCLTIAILTHGTEQHIYGVDGNRISVSSLYRKREIILDKNLYEFNILLVY